MDLQFLAMPLAYTGAMLGVAMVLPQIARTLRHPDLPGVSSLSWVLSALACLTWLAYGIRANVPPQIPGNALMIAGSVAVVLLVPSAWSRSRRALLLAGLSLGAVLISMAISPVAVGYLAFGIGLISIWPQLADSYVNWRKGIESGVSLPGWWVRIAAASCWLAYSVIAVDLPVLVASVIGGAGILAVFAFEISARKTSALLGSGAGLDLLSQVGADADSLDRL